MSPICWTRNNKDWLIPFVLVFAAQFFSILVNTLFINLPHFILNQGGTLSDIGLVAIAGGAGTLLVRPGAGWLTDRKGRRVVFLCGSIVHALATSSFLLIDHYGPSLLVARALQFAGQAALTGAMMTVASDLLPSPYRTRGFAVFMMTGMGALGIGPFLGQVLIELGTFKLVVITSCALAWLCVGCLLGVGETMGQDRTRGIGMLQLSYNKHLLPIWIAAFAFSLAYSVLPIFLDAFSEQVAAGLTGPYFLVFAVAAATVRLLFGNLPTKFGVNRVLMMSMVLLAAGLLCMNAQIGIAPFLISAIFIGVANGYLTPIFSLLTANRTDQSSRGRAFALLTTLMDLGPLIAGLLFGIVAERFGFSVVFYCAAAVATIGLLLFINRERASERGLLQATAIEG
ncbi:MFS transporter [Roseibium sp. SCP14]|uniref:MFS transporter n=1 Tax=Roseibium sp. SCP14 TaxID=3141375 RepID=UPI00333591B7